MKEMAKYIIKSVLMQLFFSILLLALGYLIAILITNGFHLIRKDVLTYEGILFLFFGVLMIPKDKSSGINLQGAGQRNATAISYQETETAVKEQEQQRKNKDYYKNFYEHKPVKAGFNFITFLLVGFVMVVYTYNFL